MKIDLQICVSASAFFSHINLQDEVEYALADYLAYGELENHDKLDKMEWDSLMKRITYNDTDLVVEHFDYDGNDGVIYFKLPITVKLDE